MGYKLIGFLVWQGGKIYLRRRADGSWPKLAIAGASVAIIVGAVAASRHQSDE
ncbi:MAG: hypothetical protein WAK93_07075 [Solirubrobacteraceae bacterium]